MKILVLLTSEFIKTKGSLCVSFFLNFFVEVSNRFKMGSTSSKDPKVDSNGQVNNNVIIQDSVQLQIHNAEILYLLYTITVIKILEFIVFVYNSHAKRMKRKYNNQNRA